MHDYAGNYLVENDIRLSRYFFSKTKKYSYHATKRQDWYVYVAYGVDDVVLTAVANECQAGGWDVGVFVCMCLGEEGC